MNRLQKVSLLVLLVGVAPVTAAQVAEKKSLTLDGARKVIAVAKAEAVKNNAGGAIAVVDDGGNLVAVERIEGTFAAAANISIGKARTAALFRRPTALFEEIIGKGRTAMVAVPDFLPLQGGVPILVDGQVVGAVGVSGAASAKQDEEIAVVAAMALSATSATNGGSDSAAAVTYLPGAKVSAAFDKGAVLVREEDYMVHASHRDGPGMAEVHDLDTDIIYVLEGTATFVTGGTMVDGKTVEPSEVRGASIRGGETRRLAKGDVVVVPHGTPHWFQEVSGPFNYYVVKVR